MEKLLLLKNQGKASGAVKKGTGVRIGSLIRMGSTTATRLSEQMEIGLMRCLLAWFEAEKTSNKKRWPRGRGKAYEKYDMGMKQMY
ncbi:hypothetical protein Tco_1340126 [Tanacetum coccineum]